MANPYLEVESGAEAKRYELEIGIDDVVVGRSTDCHWVISSGAVSRRHARLRRQNAQITIEDLGSSNGTFVNGVRLSEPATLKDRDSVKFGSVEGHFFVPVVEQPGTDATVSIADIQPTMLASSFGAAPPAKPAFEPPAAKSPERFSRTDSFASPEDSGEATLDPPAPSADRGTGTGTTPSMRTRVQPTTPETSFRPAPAPPQPAPAPAAPARAAAPAKAAAAGPTLVELLVIATASFVVVFGLGAVLVRFVF
jgi:pSer/pThr/pTyr-binding forkhead associated (FHA) protein